PDCNPRTSFSISGSLNSTHDFSLLPGGLEVHGLGELEDVGGYGPVQDIKVSMRSTHSSTSRYTSQAPETVTSGVPAIILPLKSSTPYRALLVTVSEKKATPNLSVIDTSTSDSVTTTTVPGTPLTEAKEDVPSSRIIGFLPASVKMAFLTTSILLSFCMVYLRIRIFSATVKEGGGGGGGGSDTMIRRGRWLGSSASRERNNATEAPSDSF